jgi:hypothetical protein
LGPRGRRAGNLLYFLDPGTMDVGKCCCGLSGTPTWVSVAEEHKVPWVLSRKQRMSRYLVWSLSKIGTEGFLSCDLNQEASVSGALDTNIGDQRRHAVSGKDLGLVRTGSCKVPNQSTPSSWRDLKSNRLAVPRCLTVFLHLGVSNAGHSIDQLIGCLEPCSLRRGAHPTALLTGLAGRIGRLVW